MIVYPTDPTKRKIFISVSVAIILFGVYVLVDQKSKAVTDIKKDDSTVDTSTSTTSSPIVSGITGNGYTIEEVPVVQNNTHIPDLHHTVVISNTQLDSAAKETVTEKIHTLQAELQKDSNSFNGWINLGTYYKMAGDFQAAISVWKYASKLAPTSFIPLGNLGDLYAYYLKDNALAEQYYNQAISVGPTQSYLYIQMATMYVDVFKDTDKAKAIIDKGLQAIPNDQALLQFKANLK